MLRNYRTIEELYDFTRNASRDATDLISDLGCIKCIIKEAKINNWELPEDIESCSYNGELDELIEKINKAIGNVRNMLR